MLTYIQGAELGPTRLWLRDRGQLVNLAAGFDVVVQVVSKLSGPVVTASDVAVAEGSGVEPHGVPNLQVNWQPDELEVAPGSYLVEIDAKDQHGRSYVWQVPLTIKPRYGD